MDKEKLTPYKSVQQKAKNTKRFKNARLFWDSAKNGMYIKIEVCPHFESKLEMLMPFKDEVLNVPAEVSRSVKIDDACYGMGLEVLDPSQDYSAFFQSVINYTTIDI